ncbi:hypothetical protein [Mycobacterium riyadhense]
MQQQLAAGNTVNVLSYSQGANIASPEMRLLPCGLTQTSPP